MKKTLMCLLIALLAVCLLAGCGEKKWSREGYFMDENENMLIIYPSEDSEHPGWSVGLITDGKIYGNYIKQDGKALKELQLMQEGFCAAMDRLSAFLDKPLVEG